MGCLQRNLRGKKGTFSSRPLKKKGRRTPDHRLQRVKKRNKYEKDMVSTVLLPLAIASKFVSSL